MPRKKSEMAQCGVPRWYLHLLACLCLLLPAVVPAASTSGGLSAVEAGTPGAGSVLVAPHFRVGETFTLHIEKIARAEVQGKVTSRQNQGGDVTVRVLAHDGAGTRIECVFGPVALLPGTDPDIVANALLQLMLASREGMTVRIVAGPRFGNPRVDNVDEVIAGYRKTLEKAVAMMPPDVGPAVQRLIEPMLANKQAFAAKLLEDLFVYFAVLGADVPLQGAIATAGQTPSLIGGPAVKTWSTLRVERYDQNAGRVQLRYLQTSNPDDARKAAERLAEAAKREAVAQSGGDAGQGAAAAENPAATDYRFEETGHYDVNLNTGWADAVERVRTVQVTAKATTQKLVEETRVKRVQQDDGKASKP